ncbi:MULTISPECIES: Dabb family protein [unclassified Microbacterium]|uniref:Dabb family protein n=1 Tax=unclassified Microbacterium TaxID=2609290 RepID=UPI00214CF9C7|nr:MULTISPECIES: Dabb family protein [unclassified Microbacterium]MCR2783707.1 Dabb family protein [Microbacterium sp. zg.B96]MDL5351493.1 Dabb family protein [Microbacterium sp. zg-YB36]WIM15439.1 Dabb family protein [Microbacterium sp. zg-B96]
MIRHIVAFKLAADDAATRTEQAAEAGRRLEALVGVVPTLRSMSAGANALDLPGNWELALVADFDDVAGLDAYQEHPAHKEVAAFIGGIRSDRVAVDLEI